MTGLFDKYSLSGVGFDTSNLFNMQNQNSAPSKPQTDTFLKSYINKNLNIPGFGKDKEGNTFQDRFGQAFESYRPKEKTSEEKIADRLAAQMGIAQGSGGGGFTAGLPDSFGNPSFMVTQNSVGSPTVIQGQQGEEGYGPSIGGALGKAYFGPIGGAIGSAVGSIFCDIRLKEDIAPLCKSEVNDLLSECAFFVKDLNECS